MPRARRSLLTAAESIGPSRTLFRMRVWLSVDLLITLAIALLAFALAVGYQALRHLPVAWLPGREPS